MIIVTGGAGFIGTNLVRSLIESGKQILIIEELDRYTKKFENIKNLEILDCLDHNIFLKDLLNGKHINKIDQIFHLGACSKTTEPDRDYIMDVNLNYSKKLLEYSANNSIDMIYASSASVYGGGTIFKEDSNVNLKTNRENKEEEGKLFTKLKAFFEDKTFEKGDMICPFCSTIIFSLT